MIQNQQLKVFQILIMKRIVKILFFQNQNIQVITQTIIPRLIVTLRTHLLQKRISFQLHPTSVKRIYETNNYTVFCTRNNLQNHQEFVYICISIYSLSVLFLKFTLEIELCIVLCCVVIFHLWFVQRLLGLSSMCLHLSPLTLTIVVLILHLC